MTSFSWLYGPNPDTITCKHCGDPINPAIRRTRWDRETSSYLYLDREVCDDCRRTHPVSDGPVVGRPEGDPASLVKAAGSSDQTSPSDRYSFISALISRAYQAVVGPS